MSKDPFAILDQADHMRGMEKVEMRIVDMWQPFANLVRVKGRINPTDSKMWQKPNVAVRIDVETIEGKRPTSRVYTVRKYDPSTQTVEIDFVICVGLMTQKLAVLHLWWDQDRILFPMKIALFQRFSLPMKLQYRQFTQYYNNGPKAQKQNYI